MLYCSMKYLCGTSVISITILIAKQSLYKLLSDGCEKVCILREHLLSGRNFIYRVGQLLGSMKLGALSVCLDRWYGTPSCWNMKSMWRCHMLSSYARWNTATIPSFLTEFSTLPGSCIHPSSPITACKNEPVMCVQCHISAWSVYIVPLQRDE